MSEQGLNAAHQGGHSRICRQIWTGPASVDYNFCHIKYAWPYGNSTNYNLTGMFVRDMLDFGTAPNKPVPSVLITCVTVHWPTITRLSLSSQPLLNTNDDSRAGVKNVFSNTYISSPEFQILMQIQIWWQKSDQVQIQIPPIIYKYTFTKNVGWSNEVTWLWYNPSLRLTQKSLM